MNRTTISIAIALTSLSLPLAAAAKKSPAVPTRVWASFPAPAFNGVVRLTPQYFGPERDSDRITERPADAEQRVLIFDALVADDSSQSYRDVPAIALADADGVMADLRSGAGSIAVSPGVGRKIHLVFWAPKGFVPDHLTYVCVNTGCKPLHIAFRPLKPLKKK